MNARFPSLDGMRAVSVTLVILFHLELSRTFAPVEYLWRFDIGYIGVKVFFVISGFLITTLLLKEHAATGRIDLKAFYWRRVFRIFPAYYTYLLVATVAVSMGLANASTGDLIRAALFVSDYHKAEWAVLHTWSLSVEEQFYLLWPGILLLFGMQRGFRYAAAILVVSPVLRVLAEVWPQWPNDPRLAFETVADGLATGCLLAAYRDRLFAQGWYRKLLQWKYFNLIPLGVLLARGFLPPPLLWAAIILPAMNFAIALTIDRYIRYPHTLTGRLLNSRPFVLVGTWSYSLYLWQQLFLNDAHPMRFPLNLVCIVLVAMASYYWIEQPFHRIGKRKASAAAPVVT